MGRVPRRAAVLSLFLLVSSVFLVFSCQDVPPFEPTINGQRAAGDGEVAFTLEGGDAFLFKGPGTWPPAGSGVAAATSALNDSLQIVGYREFPPGVFDGRALPRFSFIALEITDPDGIHPRTYTDAFVTVGLGLNAAEADTRSYVDIAATVTVDSVIDRRITGTFSARARRISDHQVAGVTAGRFDVRRTGLLFLGTPARVLPAPPPAFENPPAACNGIPFTAPLITELRAGVTTPLPRPRGGTLADGLYALTEFHWFAPAAPLLHRRMMIGISAPSFFLVEQVEEQGNDTPAVLRSAGRFSTADSGFMAIQLDCPQRAMLEWDGFTTTPNGFILLSSADRKAATFERVVRGPFRP